MVYANDGLTLVYDTPEAPAPQGAQERDSVMSVNAILMPAGPSNVVTIVYRVNGGPMHSFRGIEGPTDYRRNTQQFRATFPRFASGQSVDYAVVGSCAGRQVPHPKVARELPYSFRIADSGDTNTRQPDRPVDPQHREQTPPRFQVASEFLARFSIAIEPPRIIGPTPEGIRVTWNAKSGTAVGPRLSAKVLQGADWMEIRSDGVGKIDVRAILETGEGARIITTYSGVMDWGADGYDAFLAKSLPKSLPSWTTQRFLTADPTYSWLNRLQGVSVGRVFLEEMNYVYDAYALS